MPLSSSARLRRWLPVLLPFEACSCLQPPGLLSPTCHALRASHTNKEFGRLPTRLHPDDRKLFERVSGTSGPIPRPPADARGEASGRQQQRPRQQEQGDRRSDRSGAGPWARGTVQGRDDLHNIVFERLKHGCSSHAHGRRRHGQPLSAAAEGRRDRGQGSSGRGIAREHHAAQRGHSAGGRQTGASADPHGRNQRVRSRPGAGADEEHGATQGRRGAGWCRTRWPDRYVSYSEYEELYNQQHSAGGASKHYSRPDDEGESEWLKHYQEFWARQGAKYGTGHGAAGPTSAAGGEASGSSSGGNSSGWQYGSTGADAEHFTRAWWDRYQSGGRAGQGAGSSSSSYSRSGSGGPHRAGSSSWGAGASSHYCSAEVVGHLRALGLSPGTPLEAQALKDAFHRAAKAWHPDMHTQPAAKAQAEARFKQVQQAYQALKAAAVA